MLDSSDPAEAARAAVIAAKSILSTGTNTSPEVIARAKQLVAMGEAELAKQIRARRQRVPPQGGPAAKASPADLAAPDMLLYPEGELPPWWASRELPVSETVASSQSPAAPAGSAKVVTDETGFQDGDLVLEILMQRDDASEPLRDVAVDIVGPHVVVSAINSMGYRVARRVSFEQQVPSLSRDWSVRGGLVELRLHGFREWAGLPSRVGVSSIAVGDAAVAQWLLDRSKWEAPSAPSVPRPATPGPMATQQVEPVTPPTGFPAFDQLQSRLQSQVDRPGFDK